MGRLGGVRHLAQTPLLAFYVCRQIIRYPKGSAKSSTNSGAAKPPVIVLAMAVGRNVIFDPCKEELVVDVVLAVACTSSQPTSARIVSIRTIDPPSYLTPPGIPNSMNSEAPIRAGS